MDRELLIEIGVEELPAAWLPGLTRQLAERLDGAAHASSASRRARRSRASARRGG